MNKKHIDFLILDILSLVLSFILAFYLRHHNLSFLSNNMYIEMLFIMVLLELIIYFFRNPFSGILRRGYLVELKETLIFDLLSMFASVMYLFAVKSGNEYSRIVLFLTYIIYIALSYLTRILWKKHLISRANNEAAGTNKSLLIICKEKEAEKLINQLMIESINFYNLTGLCIIDKDLTGSQIAGYEVTANKQTVLDYVSKNWIDEILITDFSRIPKEIIENLVITGIPIRFKINEIEGLEGRTQIVEKMGPINTITTVNRTYKDSELFLKRCMDIVGGLVGCLITLILMLIIGPIIYIKSPGPIIYVSDRVGKNGKIFKFYKFRSMVMNADDLKDELRKQNRNKDGMMFKIKDDPRIIPGIGNFIRKTSLDEFPQFFNVLKGDMSLVGTRPPTLDEWSKYSPYYRSRLSVKPGITGMWQISGRSNITDFDEVVKLDNEYINNWSISLDIKILFKTVLYLFKGGNDAM